MSWHPSWGDMESKESNSSESNALPWPQAKIQGHWEIEKERGGKEHPQTQTEYSVFALGGGNFPGPLPLQRRINLRMRSPSTLS